MNPQWDAVDVESLIVVSFAGLWKIGWKRGYDRTEMDGNLNTEILTSDKEIRERFLDKIYIITCFIQIQEEEEKIC